MSTPVIRLGVRAYDHLTPLRLGEVQPTSFRLEVVRCDRTPDLAQRSDLDGAEASASRMMLNLAAGDRRLVASPAFALTAFRHRCIITRRDSELTDIGQLRGRRVGLTGWPDTGQVWTRALIRDAGIGFDEIEWRVGPVTENEPPSADRIGPQGAPATVTTLTAGRTLLDALRLGEVDALMLPTLPVECYGQAAPFRQLIVDYRAAEAAYFQRVGFIPGIHLFALRREVVESHPTVLPDLLETLARSYTESLLRRVELVDTTPWLVAELDAMADVPGLDWNPYRATTAYRSTETLADEMMAQQLCPRRVGPDELFREYAEAADG
jgi:4,5-dihydroxyphthalate decarboxylase